MKDIKFYIHFTIFLLLVLINLSNNASIGKFERFIGDQGLYTQKDDVEILTIDNFKDAITNSGKAWFVEFYNTWCGFCQKFAPSWKEFATNVKGWRDVVVVAAIDCSNDQNNPLCRDYEVMGYPTLRYFGENFQESEKNYGSPMEKGTSATDHKQDLLKKIISEQIQGRGQQFPNLLPYTASNLDDIFIKAEPDITNSIFIIQEPGSLLGPEITMDLHRSSNIITHYAFSNNTGLITKLGSVKFPSVYIVNRDKQFEHLSPRNTNKTSIIETIKESLKQKHIEIVLNQASQGIDIYEKKKDVDALIEKVKTMGDVVFQMDLETTLRYSLKREVGGSKHISGEQLEALKKYLHILRKYFPFGRAGKVFLNDVNSYVNSNSVVSGSQIAQMVTQAEREESNIFSTPKKWLGCQGSSAEYRRYPCGLWRMFHYLTVNVADYEQGIDGNPRLALETMHGYIKHFFGCADCSNHFQEMAKRRELDKVSSFSDSILWLWMAHNEVNKRLSGDVSEDPEYPKIQFPSATNCPSCHNTDGTWNNAEVLKYLKHMYSSINVRYLGADTKIIHAGLEGSYNSTQEGLQEETLPLQKRPLGEGLGNGTFGDVSSFAPAKDKTYFMLPVLLVLTVLYVKRFSMCLY